MKSLKKNYAYNMVYQVLQMILPLVTAPYISRVLGTDGVGAFSYTRSIAYYFLLLGMLGINNYGNRSISQVRDTKEKTDRTFSELYAVQFLVSAFFLSAYILIFIVFNNTDKLLYVAQLPYVLSACFDINWLFFGLEEFKITVTRKVVIKLFTTAGVFLFVKTRDDLLLYSWIMNIGYFAGQCYLWIGLRKYISFCKTNIVENFKKHIKPLLILFIPILATSIYRVMDKVMIGSFGSYSEVALYENADKIVMVCLGVVTAWGNVMLPRISNLVANNNLEQCRVYLKKSFQFINCITIAMGMGICAVADRFVIIFYGNDFAGSGVLLSGLAFTLIFIGWSNTFRNQVLIPMEQDKYYVRAIITGAAVNLIINSVLIPLLGAIGAMIGTMIAELTVAICQIIPMRKSVDIKAYIIDALPFLVMGIIMFGAVRLIDWLMPSYTIISLLIQIACGAAVYCSLCLVYFIRHKDTFGYQILKRILKILHINI